MIDGNYGGDKEKIGDEEDDDNICGDEVFCILHFGSTSLREITMIYQQQQKQ